MFETLELSVIDSFQEYLTDDPAQIAIDAMLRQGAMLTVESVIEWAPEGVELSDD